MIAATQANALDLLCASIPAGRAALVAEAVTVGPSTPASACSNSPAVAYLAAGSALVARSTICTIKSGNSAPEIAQSNPAAGDVCGTNLGQRGSLNRQSSRKQIEQQHAETVGITRRGRRVPFEQFGRHVKRRSRQLCGGVPFNRTGAAEVHQHDAPADFAHDIVRLDVAMQQASRVERRQGAADVDADAGHFTGAHRSALLHDLGEGLPLDELHPDADALLVLLCAVDGDDVWMVDASEMLRLRPRLSACRGHALERDLALQLRVPGAVHGSERAGTDNLEKHQVAPHLQLRRFGRWAAGFGVCAMRIHHACEALQPAEHDVTLSVGRMLLYLRPVDRLAVADIGRQRDEPGLFKLVGQGPSPWQVAGERG